MRFAAGGAVLAIVASVITAAPAPAAGDEEQVRAVLEAMNGSYNRTDFDAFASHVCAAMLKTANFAAGWYHSRSADGPTGITVNSVSVTGNEAVANVRFTAAKHADTKTLDVEFLREGTKWKVCRYDSGRTV